MHRGFKPRLPGRQRFFTAALVIMAALAATCTAKSAELIPSVNLTKSVHQDDHVKVYGGLALRSHLAPFVKSEIGVMYRTEDEMNGNLKVRMWPVTASLWLAPVSLLYAGGGIGWYNTTLHYSDALGIKDDTSQEFGVHFGGGMRVPLSPAVGLELSGRYVFMNDIRTKLSTLKRLDPDFWTLSLGLAVAF